MLSTIRTIVSGKRQRFRDDEFDLDLTYITPTIIAMGYPAEGYVDSAYRNSASDVDRALSKYHSDEYCVINLAWRPYESISLFGGRVTNAGCLDHHPMPLDRLLSVLQKVHEWLHPGVDDLTKTRTVVIHCMAGKGRTGMVVAAYLVYVGFLLQELRGKDSYDSSSAISIDALSHELTTKTLEYFSEKRGGGVDHPSQKRYVQYVCKCFLSANPTAIRERGDLPCNAPCISLPPAPQRLLRYVRFSHMPNYNAGCIPVVHVLALPYQQNGMSDTEEGMSDGTGVGSGEHLLYNSAWVFFCSSQAKTNSVSICQLFSGDVLLRVLYFHESMSTAAYMFRVAFNTGFVDDSGLVTFPLSELDDAGNAGLESDFALEVQFDCLESGSDCKDSLNGISEMANFPGGDGTQSSFRGTGELVRIGFLELQETSLLWRESWRLVWCVIQPDNLIIFSSKDATRPDLQRPLTNSSVQLVDDILCLSFSDSSLMPISLRIARNNVVTERWLEDCDNSASMERWMHGFVKGGSTRQSAEK